MGSPGWLERFESPGRWPTEMNAQPFEFIQAIDRFGREPPPLDGEFTWPDLTNKPVRLRYEITSNSYKLLTLIWVPRREVLKTRTKLG